MKESREIELKLKKFFHTDFKNGYINTFKARNYKELYEEILRCDEEELEGNIRCKIGHEFDKQDKNIYEYLWEAINNISSKEVYERDYIDRQISLYFKKENLDRFYECNSIKEALEELRKHKDGIWQDINKNARNIIIEEIEKTSDAIGEIVLINNTFYRILELAFSVEVL